MDNSLSQLLAAVEKADSAPSLTQAVQALAAVRDEAAIPVLIQVLKYNNPGAAVAAVDGLIAIGEPAVSQILEKLDGYNYGARAWATRALAGIGDPRGLDLLLDAALHDFSLSVRRAAAKGLGTILWDKIDPQERLQVQKQVLEALLTVTADPEWVVRYGAVVGLQSLAAAAADFSQTIGEHLRDLWAKEPELAVKMRIEWALDLTDPAKSSQIVHNS